MNKSDFEFGTIRAPFFACFSIQKSTPEDPPDSWWNLSDLAFQTVRFPWWHFVSFSTMMCAPPFKMCMPPSFIFISHHFLHPCILFFSYSYLFLLFSVIIPCLFCFWLALSHHQNHGYGCRGSVSCSGCWWQPYWQNVDWEAPQNLFLSWYFSNSIHFVFVILWFSLISYKNMYLDCYTETWLDK